MTRPLSNEQEYRVLALDEGVMFPGTATEFVLDDGLGEHVRGLLGAGKGFLVGLTRREADEDTSLAPEEGFYEIGTVLKVEAVQESSRGLLARMRSFRKVRIRSLAIRGDEIVAQVTYLTDVDDWEGTESEEVLAAAKTKIQEMGKHFRGSGPFIKALRTMASIEELMAAVMPMMPASIKDKQRILELTSKREAGHAFVELLGRQKEALEIQAEMSHKMNERQSKAHREALLREQLKVIQEELAGTHGTADGGKDYRQRIDEANMPDEVLHVALEQADKLEALGPGNAESGVIRNYLDLLVALPWTSAEPPDVDLVEARAILDRDHFGMDKPKARIVQHLAVMKLKNSRKGSILLLVGPPGTGKTSLGRSVAEAMGREYVRMSLGGIRDEAEIRGHRRTYVGALPGRIIQGIRRAGVKNPVFVLDEVDKLMMGFSGDPASALLEVLDPEQNDTFADHYLEVPYDLSEVVFVATANTTASIPPPLLDRMEVIDLSGYTASEKREIASRHLWKAVLDDHGIDGEQLVLVDGALDAIIARYTREAGVRGLKKQLAAIARAVSEKIVVGDVDLPYVVTEDMLRALLGPPKVRHDSVPDSHVPGVVTGLAWTPVGGEILFIESSLMPGKGNLILTGQLGDVMKESARISMSLIRSRLAMPAVDLAHNDVHIHVPSGAIPKDGPSAGIGLFTSLASMVQGQAVDAKLAMTGEITLRGSVMPVGGLKEKLLAAHRAGIERVLLSRENEDDLEEVPEEVRDALEVVLVDTVEDVMREVFGLELPKPSFHLPPQPVAGAV